MDLSAFVSSLSHLNLFNVLDLVLTLFNVGLVYFSFRNTYVPSLYVKMVTRSAAVTPEEQYRSFDLVIGNGGPGVAKDLTWTLEGPDKGSWIHTCLGFKCRIEC